MLKLLKNEERLEDRIKTQVSEVMEDKTEKEARMNNVIMFNIPEGDQTDKEKASKEDIEQVKKVVKFVSQDVNTNNLNKEKVFRLGKPRVPTPENPNPKPRPLKVILEDPAHKKKLVANSRKLLDYNLKKVGISEDKPWKEREELRAQRELKNKNEKIENSTLTIDLQEKTTKLVVAEGSVPGAAADTGKEH